MYANVTIISRHGVHTILADTTDTKYYQTVKILLHPLHDVIADVPLVCMKNLQIYSRTWDPKITSYEMVSEVVIFSDLCVTPFLYKKEYFACFQNNIISNRDLFEKYVYGSVKFLKTTKRFLLRENNILNIRSSVTPMLGFKIDISNLSSKLFIVFSFFFSETCFCTFKVVERLFFYNTTKQCVSHVVDLFLKVVAANSYDMPGVL